MHRPQRLATALRSFFNDDNDVVDDDNIRIEVLKFGAVPRCTQSKICPLPDVSNYREQYSSEHTDLQSKWS